MTLYIKEDFPTACPPLLGTELLNGIFPEVLELPLIASWF